MKVLIIPVVGISLAVASSASAAPARKTLADALFPETAAGSANQTTSSSQAKRKADPDQGDEHASARAFERVCGGNTPAAQRSAICNGSPPASP